MITYIPTIKDTRTQLLSQVAWEQLTSSKQTKQYIDMFRKTGMIDWKQRLPAVNFHGYDPRVLKGMAGSRKQADLVPTGLFMLDVDHIDNPKAIWTKLKKQMKKEGIDLSSVLALVHITPSGKGIRIVMKGREGSNVKDDQKWLAGILCVQHDECTKDLSRWSFIPMKSDILYQNNEILFANAQETSYNQTSQAYSQRVETPQSTASSVKGNDIPSPCGGEGGGLESGSFPSTFRGYPYSTIVERLVQLKGGQPEVGERHATIIYLANNLKTICDQNVDWLMEIIPSFGKPRSEKRDAITWAVQHKASDQSSFLKKVLEELANGEAWMDETDREAYFAELEEARKKQLEEMPTPPKQMPKLVELLTSKVMDFQRPAVAQMVFPSLAAHVADSIFINNENKKFELSLMGVLVGKQSVGKGCIDAPVECIIQSILNEDDLAREELRAWAESQQNKKANEKGSQRPEKPIRILNTDTTPAALLANLYNAQHNGYAKNLCCFTKSEEIEEMYDMSPTSGRSKVAQLIKKTYDRGRIGSERFNSSAANYTTVLRWNWLTSCTPDKAKAFFKRVLTDGTLSRVDFATIISTEEDVNFVYGDYDEAFEKTLEPYIQNLRDFRCEKDARGRLKPFKLQQLSDIESQMDAYIREYAKTMPDDTWKNYAWRTKLNCLKKILILYIANGGQWEDSFEPFCWWSFHYAMWVKMNLFYQQAAEAFGQEEFFSEVCIKSPLEMVNETFTRQEFYKAMERCGYKKDPADTLSQYKRRGKIIKLSKDVFKLAHSLARSK